MVSPLRTKVRSLVMLSTGSFDVQPTGDWSDAAGSCMNANDAAVPAARSAERRRFHRVTAREAKSRSRPEGPRRGRIMFLPFVTETASRRGAEGRSPIVLKSQNLTIASNDNMTVQK